MFVLGSLDDLLLVGLFLHRKKMDGHVRVFELSIQVLQLNAKIFGLKKQERSFLKL